MFDIIGGIKMTGYIDYNSDCASPIPLEEKDRLKKMSPEERQAEADAKKRSETISVRIILSFLISIMLFLFICSLL
jgi:hypothetical protein